MLDVPNGGAYLFGDKDVTSLSDEELTQIRNERIGFIFQTFNLIGDLTVWENVELPLTYRSMSTPLSASSASMQPSPRWTWATAPGIQPGRAVGWTAAARRGRASDRRRPAPHSRG